MRRRGRHDDHGQAILPDNTSKASTTKPGYPITHRLLVIPPTTTFDFTTKSATLRPTNQHRLSSRRKHRLHVHSTLMTPFILLHLLQVIPLWVFFLSSSLTAYSWHSVVPGVLLLLPLSSHVGFSLAFFFFPWQNLLTAPRVLLQSCCIIRPPRNCTPHVRQAPCVYVLLCVPKCI